MVPQRMRSVPAVREQLVRAPQQFPRWVGPAAEAGYLVRPGDSLNLIAQMYDTTWPALFTRNQPVIGMDPDLILPGATLLLR
jgi:hypothetical protein